MDFLKRLGIQKVNFGSSTGQDWFKTKSQGELKIYSPVDGKLIASVYQASEKDYEKIPGNPKSYYLRFQLNRNTRHEYRGGGNTEIAPGYYDRRWQDGLCR